MNAIIIIEVLLIVILLAFAEVTAASEISFIASSRFKLRRMVTDGSRAAKIILKILETPERFFGTILVANNIVDALIASIVTAIVIKLLGGEGKGVVVATLTASFLIIVSEVAAKTFAAKYSERISLFLAIPMKFLIKLLAPFVKILEVTTNFIVKAISGGREEKKSLVSEDEIKALIKIGEEEGVLHKDKVKMLSKVFDFSNTVVRSVMTPKKEMVIINIDEDFDTILSHVIECGYSRIPVYKESPDNIVGVVNAKDFLSLTCNRDLIVMHDIIAPVTSIPDDRKVAELLKEFQKGHTHLAVVTDKDGKAAGIVTLEDLLEEIVGEIEDEYDVRVQTNKKEEAPERSRNERESSG